MTNPPRVMGRMTRRQMVAGLAGLTGATGVALTTGAPRAVVGQSVPSPPVLIERIQVPVRLCALRTDADRGDLIGVVGRVVTVDQNRAVGGAALRELFGGLSPEEIEIGMKSAIPAGVELLGLAIGAENRIATIDLSEAFVHDDPGAAPLVLPDFGPGVTDPNRVLRTRMAQVVHTLTQFPTVEGVRFRISGAALAVPDPEGNQITDPVGRDAFEDLAPLILVEDPTPFATVSSRMRVTGTANTFEANLQLIVADWNGLIVLEDNVQATSGSGIRGTFDVTLPLPAELTPGRITLIAFEYSARDGSQVNIVEFPLVYQPAG